MNYINKMKPIIKKAGDLVMAHVRKDIQVSHKKDKSIVTDVDVLSEQLLKAELAQLIPGSGFIAEESGTIVGNEFTWVIDPIDGTKNFARGLPYFCINVALMQAGDIVAAITYYPAMDTWFYAQKGYGAWMNDQRLMLNKQNWEQKGLLMVISDFHTRQCDMLAEIKKRLADVPFGVRFRVFGSAALDLAYVAAGSFDAVLFENLGWWDAAAGILLITEAGGHVSQFDGSAVDQSFTSLIAGHVDICKKLIPLIK